MFPNTAYVVPEKPRLSRRSHKNSKDGCPNCRANRIKCSEDIPSCSQCTKKNLRCGYLDFPPERLKHIQRKNEMLRSQNSEEQNDEKKDEASRKRPHEIKQRANPPAPISVPPVYHNAYHMQPPQQMAQFTQQQVYPPPLPSPGGTLYPMRYEMPMYMSQIPRVPSVSSGSILSMPQIAGGPISPLIPQMPFVSHVPPVPQAPVFMPQQIPSDYGSSRVPPGPSGPPPHQYHVASTPNTGVSPPVTSSLFSDTSSLLSSSSKSSILLDRAISTEEESRLRPYSSQVPRPSVERISPKQAHAHVIVKEASPHVSNSNISQIQQPDVNRVVVRKSTERIHTEHTTHHRSKHGRKRIKVVDNASDTRKKSDTLSTHFRSVVYSNMFRDLTHDLDLLEGNVPHDFMSWNDGHFNEIESFSPKNPFFFNEPSDLFESHPETPGLVADRETHNRSLTHTPPASQSARTRSMPSPQDKFLPNCVVGVKKFKILKVPEKFQSNYYADTLEDFKKGCSRIQFKAKFEKKYFPPVLRQPEYNMLWMDVFLRATAFELFFIYFIDKSINLLMRASEKIVNGDIVYSSSPESSCSSSQSGSAIKRQTYSHFFYNKEDLDALTSKSYFTYGRVISELRKSINLYSPEFPTRLSFFSAWACYLNPQSDLDTFSLMVRGALALIRTELNQCLEAKSLNFRMHGEFQVMEIFMRHSRFPDYNFSVVQNLMLDFQKFKTLVDKFVSLHEDGWDLSEDVSTVISNPIFRHDYHELRKFLEKLVYYFYPRISAQNKSYKADHNYADDNNIHFVSPSLLFKMSYDWFYSYPDETMYMGSKTKPLEKIMYMFYYALGKCMTHAFTPLKSVSIVDACNISCTKVGMVFSKPDAVSGENNELLQSLMGNLMRTIRFFEIRSELVSYHIIDQSVLDEEFIKAVPRATSLEGEYSDIVHILPKKLKIREKQVENFSRVLSAHNFPFFQELYDDPVTAELIHSETERQLDALQNEPFTLDYTLGLSNHDFNPTKIVTHYCSRRRAELGNLPEVPHEQLSIRIDQLLKSRDVISNSSRSQSNE